jgi:hypothetical protein
MWTYCNRSIICSFSVVIHILVHFRIEHVVKWNVSVTDTCGPINIATNYVLTCDNLAFINKISHEPTHMEINVDEVRWPWWPILQALMASSVTRRVVIFVLSRVSTGMRKCSVMLKIYSCPCCQSHVFQQTRQLMPQIPVQVHMSAVSPRRMVQWSGCQLHQTVS